MRVYLLVAALLVLALACGKDQEAPPQPFSAESVLIALDDEHEGTNALLTLIDLSTGETVGELTSGYQTWALFRPSAGELLVSDLEGDDFQGRLRVFDVRDTGAPKQTIPMPDRNVSTVWAQAMALSGDERYLYYTARVVEEKYPHWIGIIDLIMGEEVARPELPVGCGQYPTIAAIDRSNVQVFCPANRFVTVDPSGNVSELMPFPLPTEALESLSEPTPSLVRTGRDDVIVHGCLGPGRTIPCPLGDNQRILAFNPWDAHFLSGLLVYSEEDPTDVQQFELPEGIVHFTPVDASTVALLEADTGRIYLLDLASGKVTRELQAPSGARWLIAP